MPIIKYFGHVKLADFTEVPESGQNFDVNFQRVVLPYNAKNQSIMAQLGFVWADRTLEASIALQKCDLDFTKLNRLQIERENISKEEILNLACEAFVNDRRFSVSFKPNPELEKLLIKEYIEKLDSPFICRFHDSLIGFLGLVKTAPDTLFVYLAAVAEKYRALGAGVGLYAEACGYARENGFKKLNGRISTANMSVMNIYASLGAKFANPEDIFLKEPI